MIGRRAFIIIEEKYLKEKSKGLQYRTPTNNMNGFYSDLK